MGLKTEELASFWKKKGFIYPSSEIYGGVAGLYDYGHLGTLLKKKFENFWRDYFLNLDDNYFEIETANIMHENVFKASGHLDSFNDPIIECSKCDFSDRADHFLKGGEDLSAEELTRLVKKKQLNCPKCGHNFKPVAMMNMMFPLKMGVGGKQRAFLRPETAQSPYVNFKLQFEMLRKRLPLGLALIGRAYRNEISPRNLTLRQREFTQAELQIFFNPSKINECSQLRNDSKLRVILADQRKEGVTEKSAAELIKLGLPRFYVYHLVKIQEFYLKKLKIPPEKFRFFQLNEKERAFYNLYHFDLEIDLQEQGFTEVGGLHYRTDHDLQGHQKVSKEKMEIFDEASNSKFIPHVLELSFGVDRNIYALLDLNYCQDEERGNVVLTLLPPISPFFAAVFPLVRNNSELVVKAEKIAASLKQNFSCFYDESGSIGRRYARADEMGVNYGITVDFESLVDEMVTIRNRDTTKQKRVKISELKERLQQLYLE